MWKVIPGLLGYEASDCGEIRQLHNRNLPQFYNNKCESPQKKLLTGIAEMCLVGSTTK